MIKKAGCHKVEEDRITFPMFATTQHHRVKDSDYISHLWRQQRELMNKDILLTEETRRNACPTPKPNKIFPGRASPELATSYMFQSRVRPAFNKGKTLILAVNPEKHLELEKERQIQQERRNKPKSPIRLAPIEVKSLQTNRSGHAMSSTVSPNQHIYEKSSSSRCLTLRSSSSDVWSKQMSIPSIQHRNSSKSPDMNILQTIKIYRNVINEKPQLPLLPAAPLNQANEGFAIETLHFGKPTESKKLIKLRKPLPRSELKHRSSGSHQDLIIDVAQQKDGASSAPKDDIKLSPDKCCDNGDEDCTMCSKYGSKLPIVPYVHVAQSIPAIQRGQSRLTVSTPPAKQKIRRSLVIQLPDINCTPPTPASATREPLPISRQHMQLTNFHKAQKQKELRQNELKNLFQDISELNQVNNEIVSVLQQGAMDLD